MAVPAAAGKILLVDLDNGETRFDRPSDDLYLTYLGGYGLGAYYLYKMQRPGADPLGPENVLGFFTGLLTGTTGITSNRYVVVAKSPKTGGWGDANSGGTFGPAMKTAGVDAIIFTGASQQPVYLLLKEGKAELLPADELWGLDTNQTEDRMEQLHGKNAHIASIGPAGEQLSLLAAIINDRGRAAARSGLGAVMGSKKLKALVMADGVKIMPMADPEGMKKSMSEHREFLMSQPRYESMNTYGTAGAMAGLAAKGDTPMKNWGGVAEVDFPNVGHISDDAVVKYSLKKYACWRCPIACGGISKVDAGPFAVEGHKPEYETLGSFGSMCLNDNVESIILCNDLCNRLGLDTIGAGTTIAFAIECFENGLIGPEDTGGVELRWGNAAAIVETLRLIGRREGFGALLADGAKLAAERIGKGAGQFAMHVGGEELPMHDPRRAPSIATTYKIDATPGRHTQMSTWISELGGGPPGLVEAPQPLEPYQGKGKLHARMNNFFHTMSSSGMCMLGMLSLKPESVSDSLTHTTGHSFTLDDVLTAGARIAALRTAFNLREGVRNIELEVPDRVLGKPPLPQGPTAGFTVDEATHTEDYLSAMGWDPKTGVPRQQTLIELGLDFVAKDLADP